MTTIAIIGAGFSGTLLAVHLLRQPPVTPLQIVLINRSGLMARGVAYGTRTAAHVLNVPTGRMGAFPDEEQGFLEFARRQQPRLDAASFAPRRLYGDYLEWLLTEAASKAQPGCRFRAMVGEVNRLRPQPQGGAEILLSNGDRLQADRVVLSMGHYAPAPPPVAPEHRDFYSSPRYIADPWRPDALWGVKPEQPVLLIGTGLTMLDMLLDLRDRGHEGAIHAVSRRGLLPLPHRDLELPPIYDEQLPRRLLAQPSARHYLHTVRKAVAHHTQSGGDWRDVIGALRSVTPQLWQALPNAERVRFLRHVRPHWETHRHRCAPQLGRRLQQELHGGSLRVQAARIVGYEDQVDSVDVLLRARGTQQLQKLRVGAVINCTGPDNDTRKLSDPLLRGLREDGLMVPDRLGLGFEMDARYALCDRQLRASSWLHYIGPFLKGREWEAVAVPELRRHAARLAQVLRQELGEAQPRISGFVS